MNLKEKVHLIIKAVNSNDQATLKELVHPDYIQHNPSVPTGRAAFLGVISALQEHNTKINIIRIIQDGNDVITHTLIENAALFGAPEVVTFDIWRFNEDGILAEHWDAIMANTPPNPSGRTLTGGPTEVKDLDKTEENRNSMLELFDKLINGKPEDMGSVLPNYFDMNYKQYNPDAGDGIMGFAEAMQSGKLNFTFIKQYKVFAEGNMVLSVGEGTHRGNPAVLYDFVSWENGKIVEHWDVIQDIPAEPVNTNTMFNFD